MMNAHLRSRLLGMAAALLAGSGMVSTACQICLPLPKESLADRILAAGPLVLAREDPETPFSLRAVRFLKGNASEAPPVDLFLDSVTRSQLAGDTDLALLCAWFPETKEWRQLALHDDTLAPVVSEAIANAESWTNHPDERVRYFARFLGHENATLSDLAHLEVARAPYGQLLQYAGRIPRERLHAALENHRRMEWHALYILFLGKSENPRDHEFIRRELERAAEYRLSIQTAAWATALIEIDGSKGVDRVAQLYLSGTERGPDELSAIHAALRVHGDNGTKEIRDKVVSIYPSLLECQSALAPDLAEDLTRWQRFDHTGLFSGFLANHPPDLATAARIRNYLRGSEPKPSPAPPAEPRHIAWTLASIGGLILIPLLLALHGRARTAQTA